MSATAARRVSPSYEREFEPQFQRKNSFLESYRKGPSLWVDKISYSAEIFDRAFMAGQHAANIGEQISKLNGDSASAARCKNAFLQFDAARDMLIWPRVLCAIEGAVTGKIFWKTNKDGSWKRAKMDGEGNFILNPDGSLIDDPNGAYVLHDWKDIAMSVMALFARVFSFVNRIHKLAGKDIKWMHSTIFSLWSAILALNWVSATIELYNANTVEEKRKAGFNFASATLDVIALGPDFAGICMKGHPALSITASVICLLAAAAYPLKEFLYYSS